MSTWRAVWEWQSSVKGGSYSIRATADTEAEARAIIVGGILDTGREPVGPVWMADCVDLVDIRPHVTAEKNRRANEWQAAKDVAREAEERAELKRLLAKHGAPT